MKFGKQFELYKIPEWFEYYFDYKGIKLVLKFLDNRPVKKKKLKALQMIKKNYDRKYSSNISPQDKLKRKMSSLTNESLNTINLQINSLESKKNRLKKREF